jgi:N-acetylmuramoyl-L-alanine amidase
MKLSKKLKLAAIFTGAIALTTPLLPVLAQFTEEPVPDDDRVIAVAVPAGAIGYSLAVIEQIPGKQDCFALQGSEPTVVDPLWTTFDFTGSCRRATDSNGYSVRFDGQDTSLNYRLDVVPKGDELQLIARNYQDKSNLVVGQTNGIPQEGQYLKIDLNPGWEFTKKAYEGKVLGHYFFSGDPVEIAAAGNTVPDAGETTASSSFSDISRDIYKDEIEQAVALGFIAGYKDNTFRPTEPLTREQLVSMVYGALESIDSVNLEPASSVPTQPYPDVDSSRWSAAKIQWAKENDIVKGYPDGTFQPGTPVTRAELIAVLQNAAKFGKMKQGESAELVSNQESTDFSDISNHWGAETIQAMSAYCNVASAYQETGDSFNPDTPAQRDYAAAATLRTHNCLTVGKTDATMDDEAMNDDMNDETMNDNMNDEIMNDDMNDEG